MNTMTLRTELSTLRTAIAAHRATADAAMTLAWELEGMVGSCVEVAAAKARYEELVDSRGYFWAISRMRDLEIAVEGNEDGQLSFVTDGGAHTWADHYIWTLRGHNPKANEIVESFLDRTFDR
jgi:hypothetical protein